MQKQTVLDYFGGVMNTARVLGISHTAVSRWPEQIPPLRAFQLERLTQGTLQVDEPKPEPEPAA